jgi:Arc/MetJ-type ribon-helix-helix transcriptional regulator
MTSSMIAGMKYAKVAISIDEALLKRVDRLVRSKTFQSRSQAFQHAVEEKLNRLDKSRLARECAKLSRREEKVLADLGLSEDAKEWPDY